MHIGSTYYTKLRATQIKNTFLVFSNCLVKYLQITFVIYDYTIEQYCSLSTFSWYYSFEISHFFSSSNVILKLKINFKICVKYVQQKTVFNLWILGKPNV